MYEALEAGLLAELAPEGMLQTILVTRIVCAAWRLERAERIEAEMLQFRMQGEEDLGLAIMRDGNSSRSFDSLLRYRGGALAEFFRALRTLEALQAEARRIPRLSRCLSNGTNPKSPQKLDFCHTCRSPARHCWLLRAGRARSRPGHAARWLAPAKRTRSPRLPWKKRQAIGPAQASASPPMPCRRAKPGPASCATPRTSWCMIRVGLTARALR